jgi:hypothetical protein
MPGLGLAPGPLPGQLRRNAHTVKLVELHTQPGVGDSVGQAYFRTPVLGMTRQLPLVISSGDGFYSGCLFPGSRGCGCLTVTIQIMPGSSRYSERSCHDPRSEHNLAHASSQLEPIGAAVAWPALMTHRADTPGHTAGRPATRWPTAWARGLAGDGATSINGWSDVLLAAAPEGRTARLAGQVRVAPEVGAQDRAAPARGRPRRRCWECRFESRS